MLEDSNLHSTEPHLVYIDCKKAFDSVTHNAIFEVLEHYIMGPHCGQLIHRRDEGGHYDMFINGEAGPSFPILHSIH
jgi:hypothetical protein